MCIHICLYHYKVRFAHPWTEMRRKITSENGSFRQEKTLQEAHLNHSLSTTRQYIFFWYQHFLKASFFSSNIFHYFLCSSICSFNIMGPVHFPLTHLGFTFTQFPLRSIFKILVISSSLFTHSSPEIHNHSQPFASKH